MIKKEKENNRQKEKDEFRDQILDSALTLFAAKGYSNTSIEDIKRKSNISTSRIYNQFKNKQTIAKTLYIDLAQRMQESLREIDRANTTVRDTMRAVVDLMFDLTEQAPNVMRFLLLSRHQDILLDEELQDSSAPFNKIKDIIDAGIKTGEIRRVDSALIDSCFQGVVARAIELRLDGTLEKPLARYFNDVWSMIWSAVEAK